MHLLPLISMRMMSKQQWSPLPTDHTRATWCLSDSLEADGYDWLSNAVPAEAVGYSGTFMTPYVVNLDAAKWLYFSESVTVCSNGVWASHSGEKMEWYIWSSALANYVKNLTLWVDGCRQFCADMAQFLVRWKEVLKIGAKQIFQPNQTNRPSNPGFFSPNFIFSDH